MKRNNTLIREWIAALRSGKYKQTKQILHGFKRNEEAYCCLGVLCEIAVSRGMLQKHPDDEYYYLYQNDEFSKQLDTELYEFKNIVGLSTEEERILIHRNDDYGEDFNYIADYIETNILDKEVSDGSNQSNT